MKNLLTIHCTTLDSIGYYERYLRAQIENSLRFGWKPEDIVVISDIEFEFMGVKARLKSFDTKLDFCPFVSKWVGMTKLMQETSEGIWFHDLDAWQNDTFDVSFNDFGVVKTKYGIGGSIFCRSSGKDIVQMVLNDIEVLRLKNDEVSLNRIITELGSRFTILNSTYNLGSTGFENRLKKAILPAKVLHFHPERNYDKFRNVASVTLLEVLFKHFCGS